MHRVCNYIQKWEARCYQDGIPDELPSKVEASQRVPSYKAIVKALLKNDNNLISLGYEREKCESYMNIKKAEINQRKGQTKDMFL